MPFDLFAAPKAQGEKRLECQLASTLCNALRSLRLLKVTPNLQKWEEPFRRLLHKYSELEVQAVLEWYVQHIKDEYMPMVRSAKAFQTKYEDIKAKFGSDPNAVQAGPRALAITQAVLPWGWSVEIQDCLAELIQKSLDAHEKWAKGVISFMYDSEQPNIHSSLRLLDHLIDCRFLVPGVFVQYHWLPRCHREHVVIPRWLILDPESQRFNSIMRGEAQAWCGNPRRWDKIVQLLKEMK